MSTTLCLSNPEESYRYDDLRQSLVSGQLEGRTGELNMRFCVSSTRTELDGSQHCGLLRASRPVYRKPTVPDVQIVHLGPGCMDNDVYIQRIVMERGSEANVGYQSYTKVLPGANGTKQSITIYAREGSALWLDPSVVIPYARSTYLSHTTIDLDDGATVFLPEIVLLGQSEEILRTQSVAFSRMYTSVTVYAAGKLVLRDCIDFGMDTLTRGRIWRSGFSVMGTLLVLRRCDGLTEDTLHHFCTSLDKDRVEAGVTALQGIGFAVRLMGQSVEIIRDAVAQIQLCVRGNV